MRISAPTGDQWLQRYAAEGAVGLEDRSRRPPRSPAPTAPTIERAGLGLRAAPHLRLPQALRGQSVAFHPTATDGRWASRFLTDDLGPLDLREPA